VPWLEYWSLTIGQGLGLKGLHLPRGRGALRRAHCRLYKWDGTFSATAFA